MNFGKMFSTIDTHVAGEAFRIVTQSPIRLNEKDIQANNDYLQAHFENEKNLLLNEPRGHRDMHGCIIIPSDIADIGLLFFNHDEQVDFTYSSLIAVITALLETGNIQPNNDHQYAIETAHGIYNVSVTVKDSEVRSVYVESGETSVDKDDGRVVQVDGKRRYVVYPLPDSIPTIDDKYLLNINDWGRETCAKLQAKNVAVDGVVLVEEENSLDTTVQTVTFETDGNIVRSPGVDTTIALLAAKNSAHESIKELTNESIFGSQLTAKKLPEGNRYSIETEAFVTGLQDFIFDEDDPLKDGFLLK